MSGSGSSKANKEQAAIVHRFVHDLKNKIGGMALLAEMFKEQDEETKEEILDQIKISSREALRLSEELMEGLQVDRSIVINRAERLNFSELIMDILGHHEGSALDKKIELLTDIEQEVFVQGQKELMRRIPEELIGNAIKFCSSGDRIRVELLKNEGRCTLVVKDDGPGLLTEELPLVFKRYCELSTKPTNGESSSLRGLADVLLIVSAHKGDLQVSSEGKGTGCQFIFEMPLDIRTD